MKTKAAALSERVVRLRVTCRCPLDALRRGAEFGLQDNSTTSDWLLHAGRQQRNGDLHFECDVRIRRQPRTGAPNFIGSFVHGPVTERFLYLSWRSLGWRPGSAEPSPPCWTRRMKIHLREITWPQIDSARKSGGCLQTMVDGIGRDGGPAIASVPLIGGWSVARN